MLSVIIGAIIAVLVAISVEYLRRPSLTLFVETPPYDGQYADRPATNVRFVRVKLFNQPLNSWARWMLRGPALQCRGAISFHHLDGQNVFGRVMDARWSGSPEPVPIQAITPTGQQFQIFDPTRLTAQSRIDVYPGESELLDIAGRYDNETECYGWNNETYRCATPWRNPDWQLPSGRYLVRVVISSSDQKCVGIFRLINDVNRTDFRLEPATPEDRLKVT